MAAKVLTDAAVARLKSSTKRREIPDARATGLHLVIQPTGAKSWALRFRRPDGKSAKLTLGPVCFAGQELEDAPVLGQPLTLAAARLLAADIHRQRKLGRDVAAEHVAAKHRRTAESEQAKASTFGALVRQYIEEHGKPDVRRWREVARVLGLHYSLDGGDPVVTRDGLVQRWGHRPVSVIDGHDIYGVIDEARRHGIPGIVPRTEGISDPRGRSVGRALSGFFGWLVQHRKLATDPTLGMYCPPPPAARERVLSSNEIRWFWQGCDAIGAPFGPMAKVLLLTGVRREEARRMSRAEISADGALWTILGSRTKNHRPHSVPVSKLMREVIAATPRIEGEFVFTLDGHRPIANIAKCKDRLDAAMLDAARKERGPNVVIEPFILHDLRRTFVTGLAELGVRADVIEMAVNHVSGMRGGIAGVYNRSELLPERREALERWSTQVAGLVSGSPSNIVAMPRKGA